MSATKAIVRWFKVGFSVFQIANTHGLSVERVENAIRTALRRQKVSGK